MNSAPLSRRSALCAAPAAFSALLAPTLPAPAPPVPAPYTPTPEHLQALRKAVQEAGPTIAQANNYSAAEWEPVVYEALFKAIKTIQPVLRDLKRQMQALRANVPSAGDPETDSALQQCIGAACATTVRIAWDLPEEGD